MKTKKEKHKKLIDFPPHKYSPNNWPQKPKLMRWNFHFPISIYGGPIGAESGKEMQIPTFHWLPIEGVADWVCAERICLACQSQKIGECLSSRSCGNWRLQVYSQRAVKMTFFAGFAWWEYFWARFERTALICLTRRRINKLAIKRNNFVWNKAMIWIFWHHWIAYLEAALLNGFGIYENYD